MHKILIVGDLELPGYEVARVKDLARVPRGPFAAVVLDAARVSLDDLREVVSSRLPVVAVGPYDVLRPLAREGLAWLVETPAAGDAVARAVTAALGQTPKFSSVAEEAFEGRGLTPTERDVARLVLRGLSTREISSRTDTTEKTIKNHLGSVFKKFGVASRAELFHAIFPT